MAEEQTHKSTPAQVKRPAGTAPPVAAEAAPTRSSSREPVGGDLITKHCEVLKDSCEEPADWIAKTSDGAEIPVCNAHKDLVAINYPDIEFTYEEV